MNKEKELEAIAQAQGNYCKNNKRSCKECIIKDGEECRSYITAQIIYEKGIRVADEVRKETARECSNWLHENCCYEEHYQLVDLFDEVFGVEVDE